MVPLRHLGRVLALHAALVAGVALLLVRAGGLEPGVGLLAAVNLITFTAFLWDKRAARRAASRLPELALLTMAAAMGALGALLAMHLARHKTTKVAFRWGVPALLVAQLVLLATWKPGAP